MGFGIAHLLQDVSCWYTRVVAAGLRLESAT